MTLKGRPAPAPCSTPALVPVRSQKTLQAERCHPVGLHASGLRDGHETSSCAGLGFQPRPAGDTAVGGHHPEGSTCSPLSRKQVMPPFPRTDTSTISGTRLKVLAGSSPLELTQEIVRRRRMPPPQHDLRRVEQ